MVDKKEMKKYRRLGWRVGEEGEGRRRKGGKGWADG